MTTVKYNPMTQGKKNKSSKQKTSYTLNNNNSTKQTGSKKLFKYTLKTITVNIIIVILIVLASFFLYRKYNISKTKINDMNNNLHINSSINDEFNVHIVPSGNTIEGYEDTSANNLSHTTAQQKSFEQLTPEQQIEKCQAISQDILAFRNKLSGATFRFQKLDKFDTANNDYFLLGNIGNGMVIEANQDTSLKYATKDSTNNSQKFVKTNSGNESYFINKAYPDYALQYEHDHLSLRTHNGTPFEGQKFIMLNENDKALKDAVSFGIGQPHLNKNDLQSKGPRTFVFLNSDGANATQTDVNQLLQDPALEQLTHEQLKDVVGNILRDYNQYKQHSQQLKGGVFGDKPIQFNVNLSDGNTSSNNVANVEGFTNIHKGDTMDTFIDLKNGNSNNTSLDVRALLNRYSQQDTNTLDTNTLNTNTLSNITSNNNNNLSSIGSISKGLSAAAAGTSFQGCPKIDRSNYLTGRLVSRCYGCNADSSLQ